LALLVALPALAVIGANPAGAHRGPAHQHESSSDQSSGSAEPPRNQPTPSRVPPGAPTGQNQPTSELSPAANGITTAAASGVGLVPAISSVAGPVVFGLGVLGAVNHFFYKGYTGPSDRSDRNQPTSSRVPQGAGS